MKRAFIFAAILLATFVFMGCDNNNNNNEPSTIELILTGNPPSALPAGAMIGASLMLFADPEVPVAIGMPSGNNTFTFFVPNGEMPSNVPYLDSGPHIIGLAVLGPMPPVPPPRLRTYLYMPTPPMPGTRNFAPGAPVSVDWSDFVQNP